MYIHSVYFFIFLLMMICFMLPKLYNAFNLIISRAQKVVYLLDLFSTNQYWKVCISMLICHFYIWMSLNFLVSVHTETDLQPTHFEHTSSASNSRSMILTQASILLRAFWNAWTLFSELFQPRNITVFYLQIFMNNARTSSLQYRHIS